MHAMIDEGIDYLVYRNSLPRPAGRYDTSTTPGARVPDLPRLLAPSADKTDACKAINHS